MSVIFEAVQEAQRAFHDAIAGNMTALRDDASWPVFWAVISASFLYGVFHAVGPGHGKIVVGTYLLADGGTLKRGLWITALSSLLQGAVAVLLVVGLFHLLGLARQKTEFAAAWFEAASFGLVALLGVHMIWRGINAYTHRGCSHTHCAHGHAADTKSAIAMIVSIGIRPCSGGILVMFFACLLDEIATGVAATFAMALGTGLSTSLIALAAAGSRTGALKLIEHSENRIAVLSAVAKFLGGGLLVAMGVMFCMAAIPSNISVSGHAHPLMKQRMP